MLSLNPQTRTRLINLNDLLAGVYESPHRMSHILRDGGLADEEIARLRREHLDTYLVELLEHYTAWLVEVIPARHSTIVIRRYGLDDQPRPTLAALGEQFGISGERVRQLQQNALNRLKSFKRRRELESTAIEIARRVLNEP